MSYNLLKSLYIKDYKLVDKSVDLTKVGCRLVFQTYENCGYYHYSVALFTIYSLEDMLKSLKRTKILDSPIGGSITKNIEYILNDNLKYTIKENGYDLLEDFDNVIRLDDYTFYIFQVDDFSLKLSEELYSESINVDKMRIDFSDRCKKVCDFGVVGSNVIKPLSIIDIALELSKGRSLYYEDDGLYRIMLTDKGKVLITKYRVAKGL